MINAQYNFMDILFANQTTFLSIVNYLYSPSNIAYMSASRWCLERAGGAGARLGGRHGLTRTTASPSGNMASSLSPRDANNVMILSIHYTYSACNVIISINLISNSRKNLLDMTWKTTLYFMGGGDGEENTKIEKLEIENKKKHKNEN